MTASYIPLLIDVDRDGTVGERYGVRGIPTIMLDAAGQVVRRGSFFSPSGMVKFLAAERRRATNP